MTATYRNTSGYPAATATAEFDLAPSPNEYGAQPTTPGAGPRTP